MSLSSLPSSLSFLSLQDFPSRFYELNASALSNLKSISTDDADHLQLDKFPSLEHLNLHSGFKQQFVSQMTSLLSLKLKVEGTFKLTDLPYLQKLVITKNSGKLIIQNLPSLKLLQMHRQ